MRTRQNSSRREAFLDRAAADGNMTERYNIPIEGDNPLKTLNMHMHGMRQSYDSFKTQGAPLNLKSPLSKTQSNFINQTTTNANRKDPFYQTIHS